MPQDSGVRPETHAASKERGAEWKVWVTSAPRLVLTVLGVILVGLLTGYVVTALAIFPARDTIGNMVQVPNLIGANTTDARSRVERLALTYEEASGQHHSKTAGTILAQEPLPGQKAAPGTAVRVTLSLGPLLKPVPDVVGLSQSHARIALERAGHRSEIVWVDETADVGEVVGTEPPPGTPLQLPGVVRLMVSAGPRSVSVPELATRSLAEARSTLERLGLKLGQVRQDSSSLSAPGTVIEQSPSAGVVVARGTRIRVTVAFVPGQRPPPGVEAADTAFVPSAETVPPEERDDGS